MKTFFTCLALLLVSATACAEKYPDGYADDRAAIIDLQNRYVIAMDYFDADGYAAVFAENGVLDWARGVARGRDAIHEEVIGMRTAFAAQEAEAAPLRPARLRHFITNLVLKVDGDTTVGTAFWVEFDNRNAERLAYSGAYGHSEDTYRKVDGQWLFASRKIFNENMADRTAPMVNPAW